MPEQDSSRNDSPVASDRLDHSKTVSFLLAPRPRSSADLAPLSDSEGGGSGNMRRSMPNSPHGSARSTGGLR